MQYSNKSAIRKPIINKVVLLNKQLALRGSRLPKGKKRHDAEKGAYMTVSIQRSYLFPLLEKAGTPFVYAMRQLKGRDYLKRSLELIEEIQGKMVCKVFDFYKPRNIRVRELNYLRKQQNIYEYEYKAKHRTE